MDEMLLGSSAYLKEDYVKRKFMDTWEELCKLLRIPSTIEVAHEDKEESCSTSYPEINRRVQRLLRTDEFPDYVDICDLVERCNTKYELGISLTEKMQISEKLFKAVGKVIKSRRSRDYRAHFGSHLTDIVKMEDDPAIGDSSLLEQLQKSTDEGQKLMQSLVDNFVVKQAEQEKKGGASPQGDSCHEEEGGGGGEEEEGGEEEGEGEEEEGEEACRVDSEEDVLEKGSSEDEGTAAAKRIKFDVDTANGSHSSSTQGPPASGVQEGGATSEVLEGGATLAVQEGNPSTSGVQDQRPPTSGVQDQPPTLSDSSNNCIDVGTEHNISRRTTEIIIPDSDSDVVIISDSD